MSPRDAYALSGRRLALRAQVGISGDDPETRTCWIDVAGPGEWKGHPAGPFTLDVDKFAACIAAFDAQANPIVVDYDHASLSVNPDGGAPAAGWVQSLELRGDRLWACVEWTPESAAAIRAGKFKFCSGVFVFDEPDRVTGGNTVCAIDSVALTNRPFIDGQQPIALTRRNLSMDENAAPADDAAKMLAARLMEVTGLDAAALLAALDASKDAIAAAFAGKAEVEIEAPMAAPAAPAATPAPAPPPAALHAPTSPDAVALTVDAMKAELAALRLELAPLREQAAKNADAALVGEVDAAIAAGKVHPAAKTHYVTLARSNPAAWRALSAGLPASLPTAPSTVPAVVPPSQAHSLDREAKRVELTKAAKRWGLTGKQLEEHVNRQLGEEN